MGLTLALWTVATTGLAFFERLGTREFSWLRLLTVPPGFYGMSIAHMGIAVFVVGITLTSVYSIEKDLRMAPDETVDISGYIFRFYGVKETKGPPWT